MVRYLVSARSDEGIIPEIPADIGRYDLSVDTIPWDEILILPRVRRLRRRRSHRRRLRRGYWSSLHYVCVGLRMRWRRG